MGPEGKGLRFVAALAAVLGVTSASQRSDATVASQEEHEKQKLRKQSDRTRERAKVWGA